MSTEDLYSHRVTAADEQAKYAEQMQQLRSDGDLTDEARERKMADLYASARARLRELQQAEARHLSTRWARLETELYGAPSVLGSDPATRAISARDASERASQIATVDEARSVLRRAETDRDEVLARAVARQAMAKADASPVRQAAEQWEGVFADYLDARPALSSTVDELAEIERMGKRQAFGPFSLTKPTGVSERALNVARDGAVAAR